MDRTALLKEVNRLVSSGLRKSAIDIINEYRENTPNDPFVLRALGRIYLLEKKPELAVKYLQHALTKQQISNNIQQIDEPYVADKLDNEDFQYIEKNAESSETIFTYEAEDSFTNFTAVETTNFSKSTVITSLDITPATTQDDDFDEYLIKADDSTGIKQ